MQQCPNCGHPNRAGVVFCENCGASLIGKLPLDTKSLGTGIGDEKIDIGIDSSVLTDVKVQGISSFTEGDMLRLEIEGSPEPIIFEPKAEAIFGRRDPATGAMPDIDLTPFAGYRMGVSRRHAAIRHGAEQNLDLWDLGSSNGTYLNGQRLSAHRPYRLRNGDEIRLGQMMIRISFEPGDIKKNSEIKKQTAAPESIASAEVAKDAAPAAAPSPEPPAAEVSAPPEPAASVQKAAETPDESKAPEAAPANTETKAEAAVPELKTMAMPNSGSVLERLDKDQEKQPQAPGKAKKLQTEPIASEESEKPAVEDKVTKSEQPDTKGDNSSDSTDKKRD